MRTITKYLPTMGFFLSSLCLIPTSYALDISTKQIVKQYPDEVVEGFVSGCNRAVTEDGIDPQLAREICDCYIKEIQNQYTYTEFQAIEDRVAKGEPLPEKFTELVSNCIEQK